MLGDPDDTNVGRAIVMGSGIAVVSLAEACAGDHPAGAIAHATEHMIHYIANSRDSDSDD